MDTCRLECWGNSVQKSCRPHYQWQYQLKSEGLLAFWRAAGTSAIWNDESGVWCPWPVVAAKNIVPHEESWIFCFFPLVVLGSLAFWIVLLVFMMGLSHSVHWLLQHSSWNTTREISRTVFFCSNWQLNLTSHSILIIHCFIHVNKHLYLFFLLSFLNTTSMNFRLWLKVYFLLALWPL